MLGNHYFFLLPGYNMVLRAGIEPATLALSRQRSPTELTEYKLEPPVGIKPDISTFAGSCPIRWTTVIYVCSFLYNEDQIPVYQNSILLIHQLFYRHEFFYDNLHIHKNICLFLL